MEKQCPYVLDRTGADIHAEIVKLGATQGPVAQVELPDGVPAWTVSGYELVRMVLTDPRFKKDARNHWNQYLNGNIAPTWSMINWVEMDNMFTRDDKDHDRLRRLISKAFTPRSIEAARPMIEKIVDELLDHMETLKPDQPADIKGLFAFPLPATVVCAMFGVPEADRQAVLHGGRVNASTAISGDDAVASIEQWHGALEGLVAKRQEEPGDDLTTHMIAARGEDGASLTDEELVGTLHVMLGAGSETVMNLLSHAVKGLLTHPEQRAMVANGTIGWDSVIEEALRVDSPIGYSPFRFPVEDVVVGGVTIPKGDAILVAIASTGRDQAVHGQDAAEFDITRENKTHLSFGHGVHYCLGVLLARLEASIALPRLFQRFPNMEMAVGLDELEPQGSFVMNGHRTLPVHLYGR